MAGVPRGGGAKVRTRTRHPAVNGLHDLVAYKAGISTRAALPKMDNGKLATKKADVVFMLRQKFPHDFGPNPEPPSTNQGPVSLGGASASGVYGAPLR